MCVRDELGPRIGGLEQRITSKTHVEGSLQGVVARLAATRVIGDSIVLDTSSKGPESSASSRVAGVLEIGQAVRRLNSVYVRADFPVQVAVADVSNFENGILPEFSLDAKVELPAIRHLVTRLISNGRMSKALRKARGGASGRLAYAVEEATVRRTEIADEWRVLPGDLKRIQTVAIEELPATAANGPFALPGRIPGKAEARRDEVIVVVPQCIIRAGLATECTLRGARVRSEPRGIQQTVAGVIPKGRIKRCRVKNSVTVVSKVRVWQQGPAEAIDQGQAAIHAEGVADVELSILPTIPAQENGVGLSKTNGHALEEVICHIVSGSVSCAVGASCVNFAVTAVETHRSTERSKFRVRLLLVFHVLTE